MSHQPYTCECDESAPNAQKDWVRFALAIFNADSRDVLISRINKERILGELSRTFTQSEASKNPRSSISINRKVVRLVHFLQSNRKRPDEYIQILVYHALLRYRLDVPNTEAWKEDIILAHEKPLRYLDLCARKQQTAQDDELRKLLPTFPLQQPPTKPPSKRRNTWATSSPISVPESINDQDQDNLVFGIQDYIAQPGVESSMMDTAPQDDNAPVAPDVHSLIEKLQETILQKPTHHDTIQQELTLVREHLQAVVAAGAVGVADVVKQVDVFLAEPQWQDYHPQAVSFAISEAATLLPPKPDASSTSFRKRHASAPSSDASLNPKKQRVEQPAMQSATTALDQHNQSLLHPKPSSNFARELPQTLQQPTTVKLFTPEVNAVIRELISLTPPDTRKRTFAQLSLKMWNCLGLSASALQEVVAYARLRQKSPITSPQWGLDFDGTIANVELARYTSMAHEATFATFVTAKKRLIEDNRHRPLGYGLLAMNITVWKQHKIESSIIIKTLNTIITTSQSTVDTTNAENHTGNTSCEVELLENCLCEHDLEYFIDLTILAWLGVIQDPGRFTKLWLEA